VGRRVHSGRLPSASNPVPASPYLPLREASGAIPFNRRVFHYVTAHLVRGFSPRTGDLIAHFHCNLHGILNLARSRRRNRLRK
jgi:hypothetical protein